MCSDDRLSIPDPPFQCGKHVLGLVVSTTVELCLLEGNDGGSSLLYS
jgi:hypothetical protein